MVVVIVVVVVVFVAVFDEFFAIEGLEDAFFEEEMTVRLGLISELEVSPKHILMSAVDIKMVGVGSGNDRDIGVELEEGAVVFVGLDNDILAVVVDEEIGVEVFADTTKEGTASTVGFGKQVGYHGRGSGFSVATGNGNAFLATSEFS